MVEVNPADLRSVPWHYESSRALFDTLIGDDTALPLFEAASSGDPAALRRTLEEHPEIALEAPHRIYMEDRPAKHKGDVRRVHAMKRSNVDRAMLRAAGNGHAEAVSVLLDFASRHGLQPSSVIGRETVKIALQNGDAAVFDVLATADPGVATRDDVHPIQRPLDLAMNRSCNIELIKVILQHGGGRQFSLPGHRSISYSLRGGSRLCEAAKMTKTMTELLIQHGYLVKGSGALHAAAQGGKLDIVRFLVEEHGADVNELLPADTLPVADNALYATWTPMHFAASRANEDAMRLLESYGARADMLDVEGRTPLQLMQNWKDGKSYSKTIIR